jgi:hypothetical protein
MFFERSDMNIPHPVEHAELLKGWLESGKDDPHKELAAYLWDIPVSEVTSEQREVAKNYQHHLLYSAEFVGSVNWDKCPRRFTDVLPALRDWCSLYPSAAPKQQDSE